jgi:hypothetical protein
VHIGFSQQFWKKGAQKQRCVLQQRCVLLDLHTCTEKMAHMRSVARLGSSWLAPPVLPWHHNHLIEAINIMHNQHVILPETKGMSPANYAKPWTLQGQRSSSHCTAAHKKSIANAKKMSVSYIEAASGSFLVGIVCMWPKFVTTCVCVCVCV